MPNPGQGKGEVGACLGEGASAARIGAGLLIGRRRLVEPLGPLEVASDQSPVRAAATHADQRIGRSGVQPPAHIRRRQLDGDLAQQLVAKPPTVGARWFEHQRILELIDDVVDLVIGQAGHGAQQAAIDVAADDGCRLHHRHRVRAGAQPGEQRLIQSLGHSALTDAIDELLDIERHPVASPGHRGPVIGAASPGMSPITMRITMRKWCTQQPWRHMRHLPQKARLGTSMRRWESVRQ